MKSDTTHPSKEPKQQLQWTVELLILLEEVCGIAEV